MDYYRHRIYCVTESQWVEKITNNSDALTTCPNDSLHTVKEDSACIIETISQNVVTIRELDIGSYTDYPKTHFRYQSYTMDINANATNSMDFVKPYPVNVLNAYFRTNLSDDKLNIYWALSNAETFFTLPSDIQSGSNIIPIPNGYMSSIDVGYYFVIGNFNFGEVISKNIEDNTVTMENNSDQLYSTGSDVKLRLYLIREMVTYNNEKYAFAKKKIGGAYIPKNSILRIIYKNNSLDTVAKMKIDFEFEY